MSFVQDQRDCIDYLNGVIARMRERIARQKESPKTEGGKLPSRRRRGRNVDLGAIATNDQSRLVSVTPGEALFSRSRDALRKKADKQLAAMNEKLAKALAKCAQSRNALAGPGGTRQLEDGTHVRLQRKGVSLACPEAVALMKQIREYTARQYGDTFKPASSGGGGGGGF